MSAAWESQDLSDWWGLLQRMAANDPERLEAWILWGGAVLVCALILTPYLFKIRLREKNVQDRLAEAERLGIRQAKGLFPFVDASICIGCGGCVTACPEEDVLGLAGGLAVVVNGARCIGIGQCERVCPVGAIEVALGDIKGRADMPVLSADNQTTLPGVYMAGELGGLALVHNAVAQGRDTVRQVASELAGSSPDPVSLKAAENSVQRLDLAIVGAGPAGLSAALEAGRLGLNYVVFERENDFGGTIFHYPRQKLTHTQPLEFPGHPPLTRGEYSKEELLELFETLIERHSVPIHFGEAVVDVKPSQGRHRLETERGTYDCAKILLAMGRRGTPRPLGVPGEDLPKVMYEVRDAAAYRDRRILCVGGGDSAVEAAMGLAKRPGNKVILSYRKERFFRIKKKNETRLGEMIRKGKIQPVFSSRVLEILPHAVRLDTPDGEVLMDNDLVFVLIGGIPPFPWLRNLGIQFGDQI